MAGVEEFTGKLQAGIAARRSPEFLVIARTEALVAGGSPEEALRRAQAYREAGADAIIVHAKDPEPLRVFEVADQWAALAESVPLVVIPTKYPQITEGDLRRHPAIGAVIYANCVIRLAIGAVETGLRSLADAGTLSAVDAEMTSLDRVFELQGVAAFSADEKRFVR